MNNSGKEGSFAPIIFVMIVSLAIASLWNSIPVIKNTVHSKIWDRSGNIEGDEKRTKDSSGRNEEV